MCVTNISNEKCTYIVSSSIRYFFPVHFSYFIHNAIKFTLLFLAKSLNQREHVMRECRNIHIIEYEVVLDVCCDSLYTEFKIHGPMQHFNYPFKKMLWIMIEFWLKKSFWNQYFRGEWFYSWYILHHDLNSSVHLIVSMYGKSINWKNANYIISIIMFKVFA